jgi:hypothetical protein
MEILCTIPPGDPFSGCGAWMDSLSAEYGIRTHSELREVLDLISAKLRGRHLIPSDMARFWDSGRRGGHVAVWIRKTAWKAIDRLCEAWWMENVEVLT